MSSSNLKFDDDSSSDDDNNLLMTKYLMDEPLKEGDTYKRVQNVIQPLISMVVPTMVMNEKSFHGGSSSRRCYIPRDRNRHFMIFNDYFKGGNSKYTPEHFRRRYRMNEGLFNRILQAVEGYDDYFTQKVNAAKKLGLSPLQKVTAAIRMLAQGCAADAVDEYVQIGETTAIESLKRFCDAMIGIFEEQYLRKPNKTDIEILLKEGEARGFPEVVASQSLWIWHAFFGMAGTNNDINVLDRSPLFDDLINEVAPPCNFIVQGHHYNMGYYLSDGIYPQYATLIQTISEPSSLKEKTFSEQQETVRKDVERAFGVLQSRWHIIKGPARMWAVKDLEKIMKTCIILHNMIIESEHSQGINPENWKPLKDDAAEDVHPSRDYAFLVSRMSERIKQVQDKRVHNDLKRDLIDHLWELRGGDQAN